MCLAKGLKHSDAGEALTRGPSVSSQALYHCKPEGRSHAKLPRGQIVNSYPATIFLS